MVWCKSKTDHFYWEKKKYHISTVLLINFDFWEIIWLNTPDYVEL